MLRMIYNLINNAGTQNSHHREIYGRLGRIVGLYKLYPVLVVRFKNHHVYPSFISPQGLSGSDHNL
jgi:hypothetical protein